MIKYEEALKYILKNTKELPAEKVSIEDSVGMMLDEGLYSGIEMPPFNKSAMDGYAVKAADTKNAPTRLRCVGFIEAGENFTKSVRDKECAKIMTGAALPKGADCVVMVEHTRSLGEYVEIMKPAERWENVCFKGEDIRRGQRMLNKGRIISISDVALLATIGRRFVKAIRAPEVAILNTGGEIVPVGKKLGGRKIYNSNGPQLSALLRADRIKPHFLGIAKDKPRQLSKAIKKGLKKDVLLISGGVSMGDYDLVPDILKSLGVKKVFHKVSIKPGKPLFFGMRKGKMVFGIPGNPVSNFLVYHVFIRPALFKMLGRRHCGPLFREGFVNKSVYHKAGRKHFLLAKVSQRRGRYYVAPVKSHGSADIFALSRSNAFMVLDAGKDHIKAGSKVRFITWSVK